MVREASARKGAVAAACLFLAVAGVQAAACGGSSSDTTKGGDGGGGGSPVSNDGSTTLEDSSLPQTGDDGSTVSTPPKAEGGVLKVIGSPCSVGTDCASGTCDTNVPNGMCTKACAMDSDCSEKGNSTGSACVDSMCYEFCKQVDAGPIAPEDGGKAVSPCKNKALVCEPVAGQPAPMCMPNPDAGTTSDDGGTATDAQPSDDSGTPVDAAGE
jgi:hypothetical protein